MAQLVIKQKHGKFAMTIPHKVLINGQLLGIMKDNQVAVELPFGEYDVTIQSMIPYFSATHHLYVSPMHPVTLVFSDREKWWDMLFVVDIVAWLVKRFLHLAAPWTWIYEIFTNGYFVLWLIYEWHIRKAYFRFEVQN